MSNPFVGKKFHFTYTSGVPDDYPNDHITYEMEFISETEKKSKDISGRDYENTHQYTLTNVAPDVYMLSWLVPENYAMTIGPAHLTGALRQQWCNQRKYLPKTYNKCVS